MAMQTGQIFGWDITLMTCPSESVVETSFCVSCPGLFFFLFFFAWHLREVCLSPGDDFDVMGSCTRYRECQARLPQNLATRSRCINRVIGGFVLKTSYSSCGLEWSGVNSGEA